MHPLTIGVAIDSTDLADAIHACTRELPVRLMLDAAQTGGWTGFIENARKARLDVLIIDISKQAPALEEKVRQAKGACPEAMLIAVNTVADADTILRAVRCGVQEYLSPPFRDAMVQAFERKSSELLQQKAARKDSGKVIAAVSAKGGCGSTTVICHMAAELGRNKNKVLLADLDLEAGIVGFLMQSKSPYSITDAASNLNRLDYNYWSALTSNGLPGLEIIGAPTEVAPRRGVRAEDLRPVLAFVRAYYDWVLVDLGRGLNRVATAVLEEVDETFLVTTLDVPALHQTQRIVRSLLETGYGRHRLRLVLNQAPKRLDITTGELEKMLGIPVYAALPNEASELYQAYSEGKLLRPSTSLGKHFSALVEKLAGVQTEPTKRAGFRGLFG